MVGQMIEERLHEREHVGVVRGTGKHERAVAERVLDGLGHVVAREIAQGNLRTTGGLELLSQQFRCLGCVTVNRAVCDGNARRLDFVSRPCAVETQIVAEIGIEHRTM